jgi:hypothetical protein
VTDHRPRFGWLMPVAVAVAVACALAVGLGFGYRIGQP